MLQSFPNIIKDLMAGLPKNDYPVLNTRLFVECWIGFSFDKSLTSMRDLFKRLNNTGFDLDISTFSKASSHRSWKIFLQIYQKRVLRVNQRKTNDKYATCPIDSTTITLTSKLLKEQDFHQVKLFSSLNLSVESTEDNLIVFCYAHDYNFGKKMIDSLPTNGLGVMDRGFAGLKFLQDVSSSNKHFVLRIGNAYKLEFDEKSGLTRVGAGKEQGLYRVVQFCDVESRKQYRLVTNLPATGVGAITDEEVMEIYRLRWQIELLWKFLKMHLKLDHLITKNVNGIAIQIYATLIAYLILQLTKIPKMWGSKLLDKLRYLQACMCQEISYIHWLEKIIRA